MFERETVGLLNPSVIPTILNPNGLAIQGPSHRLPAFVQLDSGTAQAGASNTLTLAATASATDDAYKGKFLRLLTGSGSDQYREISTYVGATKVADRKSVV